MPVKLDVSNSIIGAYAQGKAEAFAAQQDLEKQQQLSLENQQKQEQIDAQKKQFNDQLAEEKAQHLAQQKHEDAMLELSQIASRQALAKQAEDTGITPEGYTPVGSEEYPISSDVTGTRIKAIDKNGNTLIYRTPHSVGLESGISKAAESKPVQDQTFNYEKQLKLFESNLTQENQKNLEQGKDTQEARMEAIKNAHENSMAQIKYEEEMKLLNRKIEGDLAVTGAKATAKGGEQLWNDIPLDPVAQKRFNLPSGSTWSDALGNIKLTPKGQEDFKSSLNFERATLNAQDALESTTDNGQQGYDRYFLGKGAGFLGDLKQQFPGLQDKYVTSVAPTLAALFLKSKDINSFGARFTPAEIALVKNYVPGKERSLTPADAESMIPKLLDLVREDRINNVMSSGTKVGGTAASTKPNTKDNTKDNNDLGGGFKLGQ